MIRHLEPCILHPDVPEPGGKLNPEACTSEPGGSEVSAYSEPSGEGVRVDAAPALLLRKLDSRSHNQDTLIQLVLYGDCGKLHF